MEFSSLRQMVILCVFVMRHQTRVPGFGLADNSNGEKRKIFLFAWRCDKNNIHLQL